MNDADRDNYIIQIHSNVEAIKKMVEQHQHVLYGNGQPGLIKEVAVLATNMEHLGSRMDEAENQTSDILKELNSVEKDRAISKGKMDTGKAVIGFLINLALALLSIILGIAR